MGSILRRIVAGMVTSAVLATVGASPAAAVRPDIVKFQVDFSETFSDCGFDVVHTTVGFVTVHDYFDQTGTLNVEIANFSFTETFANPENGASIRTRDVGPNILTVSKDGSFTVATIGLITNVIVPGQGKVAGESGTIVASFDADGNFIDVVFVAGPHDDFLAAICEVLA
jgi:hypothetical protein